MYEAYEYVQEHGINRMQDYRRYQGELSSGGCDNLSVQQKWHYKNTGMVENDGMNNEEMKRQVLRQPIGAAMFAPAILLAYGSGIITEEYLHCSRESNMVNHGIVVVGFGKVTEEKVRGHHCNEYWIIRNSWGADWGEAGTFKLCMDGAFSKELPLGICHINEFGTWPTI